MRTIIIFDKIILGTHSMKKMLFSLLLLLPFAAVAASVPEYTLTIEEHVFHPKTLTIPADTRIKLTVINKDSTPEEFESNEFNVEKIIMPKGKITVFVGPLKAGSYKFFGEFHMDTAQGTLIAE